jgi:hypothetical protein
VSRVSDHVRRDAEHAARAEISILLSKYQRRLYEEAKTNIAAAITAAEPGREIDGTEIGREAVLAAATGYLGATNPRAAIDVAGDHADIVEGS